MKKLLFILSFIFCFTSVFGQFPITQGMGSSTTLNKANGGFYASVGFINTTYADTTAANANAYIKGYPFAQIATSSDGITWIRNAAATAWIAVQQGVDPPSGIQAVYAGYGLTNWNDSTLAFDWQLRDSIIGLIPSQFNPIVGTNILLTGTYPNIIFTADTTLNPLHLATQGFVDRAISDIPPSLFGSNDTLFTADRYVNMNGYNFSWAGGVSVFGADKQQVGLRYADDASNPVSGYSDNTSTATVTSDATGITFSGSATFNLSNYIVLNNQYFGSENWTATRSVVVNSKSSTTYGFGLRWLATGLGNSCFAQFLLSDTTGYIAFETQNQVAQYNNVNNRGVYTFKWSAGDTLDIKIQRISRRIVITMANRANGITSMLNIPVVYTSVATFSLFDFGGDYKFLNDFQITYQDLQYPKWAIFGNSITWGGISYNESTKYVSQVFEDVGGGYVSMAAPSEASIDGTYRIHDAVNYIHPQYLLIAYGVNDRNGSVPLDSFSNRIQRIVTQAITANITPILINCVPQSSGTVVPYNDTLAAIATRYNLRLADIYTALVASSGTAMDSKYDYGDGIHPGQIGHNVEASVIRSTIYDLLDFTSPIVIHDLPLSYQQYYNLGLDENDNLIKTLRGTDTSYILNIESQTALNVQPAGINIAGSIWAAGEMRFGGVVQSNPYLYVDLFGTTTAQNFTSRGLTTDGGGMAIGTVANPNVFLYDIRSYQRAWKVSFNYPTAAGNLGMILNTTNDDNGHLEATYKFISIRNNGSEHGYVGRAGDYHTDSVSGYNWNVNSLLTTNSWVTKGYADSIAAISSGITIGESITSGTANRLLYEDGSNQLAESSSLTFSSNTLGIGSAGAATGILTLSGSTSGTITIQPANAAGTYTLTLPTTDGNSGEFLQTDGSGVLSWATTGAASITIGAAITSGTANRVLFEDGSNLLSESASLTFSSNTLGIGSVGAATGILTVSGSTSGTITIQPANAAGTWTWTLPTDDGTNGQVLTTDGAGVTSWTTVSGGGSPGGSNTQLQYNNSSSFGGITNATSDGTTLTMTSGRATTDFSPSTNDGATLGTTSLKFSDLFLADGAVINFNSGNFTLTHSTGQLTASGSLYANGSIRLNGGASSFIINNRSNPTAIAWQMYSAAGELAFYAGGDKVTFSSNGKVGIGTVASAFLHVLGTTEQLRLGYDASNYIPFTVSSGGDLTIAPTGGDITLTSTLNIATAANIGVDTTTYKVLVRDASGNVKTSGWYVGSGSSPAGSNTELQFNNSGSFGASSSLTWDGARLSPNYITLAAGTTSAGTAPIQYTAGSLLSTIVGLTTEVNANGIYQTSNALNRYAVGGAIADFYTEVTNSGTSETDLYSYTTKANTFAADGEKLVAIYSGTFTGSATATRTYAVYFAGTKIFDSNNFTSGVGATGGDWTIKVTMIRASSSEVRCAFEFSANLSGTGFAVTDYATVTGLTLSGTNILKITGTAGGTGAGSDQIKAEMGTISWYGAANN